MKKPSEPGLRSSVARAGLPRKAVDLDTATYRGWMGATLGSVRVLYGDAGTSSRARLALTGDAVPSSVFVKMPARTAATRLMGELGRLAASC